MAYEIVLTDEDHEVIAGADGYAPEGPLTTFFAADNGRLSPWAVRLASYRTDRILRIRRVLPDSAPCN